MNDELIKDMIYAVNNDNILFFKDLTCTEIDDVNQYGYHPLRHAARRGRVEMFKYLLSKGVDINLTSPSGQSALFRACLTQQSEIIRMLIILGADLTIKNSNKTFLNVISNYCIRETFNDYEIQKYLITKDIILFLELVKRNMIVVDKIKEEHPDIFVAHELGML